MGVWLLTMTAWRTYFDIVETLDEFATHIFSEWSDEQLLQFDLDKAIAMKDKAL